MTSEAYYPEQRHLLLKTAVRRERLLPEYVSGEVLVTTGTRIALRDVVARGAAPAPYVLLDAAQYFDLRDPDKMFDLLDVRIGEQVGKGDVLAGRSGRRGKRLTSPVDGQVVEITQGWIVLQEYVPAIELEAGVNGTVISVRKGRGVIAEAYGAVLQGVWGNNRRTIGTIRFEPSDGIENVRVDVMENNYRGVVMVTRRPLKPSTFDAIDERGFSGVIAPSMEPDMIGLALQSTSTILLTEGFGEQRMSNAVVQFLEEMEGRQAMLDAVLPTMLETRRPEAIINVPMNPGERPSPPNQSAVLQVGREVRLTSGESAGMVGHVIGLPKEPILLENGLRVACAQVELVTGEKVHVPLANIEVSGA